MGGKGSGRIPVPAGLKLVNGRSEGRDSGGRIVPQTPRFIREAPAAPDWLEGVARTEWERVTPELEELGLLKAADQAAFVAEQINEFCDKYAADLDAKKLGIETAKANEKELKASIEKANKLVEEIQEKQTR